MLQTCGPSPFTCICFHLLLVLFYYLDNCVCYLLCGYYDQSTDLGWNQVREPATRVPVPGGYLLKPWSLNLHHRFPEQVATGPLSGCHRVQRPAFLRFYRSRGLVTSPRDLWHQLYDTLFVTRPTHRYGMNNVTINIILYRSAIVMIQCVQEMPNQQWQTQNKVPVSGEKLEMSNTEWWMGQL